MSLLASVVSWEGRLCRLIDKGFPAKYCIDGNYDFVSAFAPLYLRQESLVYDIGGGKQPLIDVKTKASLQISVVGLDISATELQCAPAGAYDGTICSSIVEYEGTCNADVVICQSLLEHVPDTRGALTGIASILKPGGVALLFVPSRKAWYARLNKILPERVKRAVLFTLYPKTQKAQGFPAYYDLCTPHELQQAAGQVGLERIELRTYFASSYFSFFPPLYAFHKTWLLVTHSFFGEQAAETFSIAFRKRK